jgi:hypothetical protein
LICHHYKCIFVHIPKNAGQSIEHVFLRTLGLSWETRAPLLLRKNDRPDLGPPRLAHLKADEYVKYHYVSPEMFDDYFKFCIVRNPWDRMVSIYKYLSFSRRQPFKAFLTGTFSKSLWRKKHWFVAPQSEFVFDENNLLKVDFVGRFENLQADFDHICQNIGLATSEIPHVNKSTVSGVTRYGLRGHCMDALAFLRYRTPKADFPHYTKYYDRESQEIVADLYRRDIELLRYSFDGNTASGERQQES